MAIKFKFGSMSEFLPGERVLHSLPRLGVISGKALPSYQVFFPIPPLCRAALYVTDRRVLLVAHLFGCVVQEISMWYPGKAGAGDEERVQSTCTGSLRWLGPYLEVVSHNPSRCCPWLCARTMRLRFYVKCPEPLCESISAALQDGGRTESCTRPGSKTDH